MYTGINRKKQRKPPKIKFETKVAQIQLEEVENNGIISKNYVNKIVEYKSDPKIKWRDFEVTNLMAAGVDPRTQGEIKMSPNIDKLEKNASTANEILEQYEIIKELEQTRPQNE